MCIHRFVAVNMTYLLPAANEVAVMLLHLSVSHSVHWREAGVYMQGGLHPRGLHPGGFCIQREGLQPGGSASRGRPASGTEWVCIWGDLYLVGSGSEGVCIQGVCIGGIGRPPPIGYYEIQSKSRQYTPYWNAFLFVLLSLHRKSFKCSGRSS